MSSLQQKVGERLSGIPAPDIFYTDNLRSQVPALFDSTSLQQSASDSRLTMACFVSPDLFPLLIKWPPLQVLGGRIPRFSVSINPVPVVPDVQIQSLGIGATTFGCVISADVLPMPTVKQLLIANRQSFWLAASVLEDQLSGWSLPDISKNQCQQLIAPTISENQFEFFFTPKVMGMNYRDRYWRTLAKPDEKPLTRQLGETKAKRGRKPKQEAEENADHEIKPQARSFWDLLYVILLPPISLDDLGSLSLPKGRELYAYQPAGIYFLMKNEAALLADEMGTGKTVMTTVALRLMVQEGKVRHALIVCPPSVLYEWERHLSEWTPDLQTTLVRGTQSVRRLAWQSPAHVYMTSYDSLRSDVESGILSRSEYSKFDVVILDEAQRIMNQASGRTQAVKKIGKEARQRWALTATPIENKIEDIGALFDFLRPPALVPLMPFDYLDLEQLKAYIAPYILRRRKADVLKDLPEKIVESLELELDPHQRAIYDQAEQEGKNKLRALGREGVTRIHIFAVIQRLKQICNFAPDRMTSPKLEALKGKVEEIVASGHKVIVFSQYLGEGIDKLEKALRPYGVAKIVGGQTDSVRKGEVERFKKSQGCPILLATPKSGGVGLNFPEASYVIHFDHWWNPAVMWQAEDRIHRPDQKGRSEPGHEKRVVNIYSYWMENTIDQRIQAILERKGLLFRDVVDGLSESDIDQSISVDEWLEILGVTSPEAPPVSNAFTALAALPPAEMRERLYEITPTEFEHLVKDLMRYLGYPNTKVTNRTHDGGIDVIASRSTAEGVQRAAVQCKRYRGKVSVQVARELLGVITSDTSFTTGYLVTTGEFTAECIQFCAPNDALVMIDGAQVVKYVKQFGLSV